MEVRHLKLIVEGTPEEIAALVVGLPKRQNADQKPLTTMVEAFQQAIDGTAEEAPGSEPQPSGK